MNNKLYLSAAAACTLAANTLFANNMYDLGAITVSSATKSEQSIKDVTSNIEVITGAELEEKRITTVLDALRYSGISITQNGFLGQTSSIFFNGMSSGNVLVLIDGVKYNDPTGTEGQAQLEQLMIGNIAQIEIVKGAQSGIWGANAVAGVINIITKKATKELQINTNIEYGSNNTKKISLSSSQQLDKLSYYLGLNYLTSDGISAQAPYGTNPDSYEDDEYENKTFNAKLNYDFTDKDQLTLNFLDISAKTQYDAWGTPNSSNNEYTQDNRMFKVGYKHYFNKDLYVDANYSKTDIKREDPLGWTTKFEGYNKELAVNVGLKYLENSFLLLGANKQKSEDTEDNTKMESKGFFITNSNKFDNFIITQSLRHDNYDSFKDKTTGKLGLKYNITQDFTLSSNYGTAYKAPALSQSSYNATSNLQPETTKSFDASLEYKSLKLTYFTNRVKNLIEWNDPTPWPSTVYGDDYYTNVTGTSKFKGYEISYNKAFNESLLFGAKYLKQSAKDANGQDLQRRIQSNLKLSLDYYGIDKLHLGIFGNYVGTRYDDLAKTKQTGKYTLINTVANYDIARDKKIYLKIDNITDKYYQEVDGYAKPGRTFSVGLNAKF